VQSPELNLIPGGSVSIPALASDPKPLAAFRALAKRTVGRARTFAVGDRVARAAALAALIDPKIVKKALCRMEPDGANR